MLLAVGAGIFKAASLRADMNSKWSRRVSFAVAALDEKAISELEHLRDEIESMLPSGRSTRRRQSPTRPRWVNSPSKQSASTALADGWRATQSYFVGSAASSWEG